MPFKTSISSSLSKRIALCLFLGAASLLAGGCNSTESDPPPAPVDTTFQITKPANGGSFKLAEPFTMVVKCDYTKISSGLNYQLSVDAGKNWLLIKSAPKKDGIALDTLTYDPLNDPPGDVPVGAPVLIRVIDYNKLHFTISKPITFTN